MINFDILRRIALVFGLKNETDLKRFFAKIVEDVSPKNPLGLLWVEHGKGGTVGAPDLFCPYHEIMIMIEFKYWRDDTFKLRPTQYPFHYNLGRSKQIGFVVGWREHKGDDYLIIIPSKEVRKCSDVKSIKKILFNSDVREDGRGVLFVQNPLDLEKKTLRKIIKFIFDTHYKK